MNALIVEIDLEKLVLDLEQATTLPAKGTEVPDVERRQAPRLSHSEVGDHVQVSLPRATRTTVVNVSDSGVLIQTNCQLFPGRATDVFVKLRGERLALRATVVRSSLHSLTSDEVIYQSALHFERIIGLAERLGR